MRTFQRDPRSGSLHRASAVLAAIVLLAAGFSIARGDVLVGVNGERFVGQIVEENADSVVFKSELGGRFTVARSQIRSIEKTPAPPPTSAPAPSTIPFDLGWRPPGVGTDGYDWIQLKSGEWLKGELQYVQDKKVQFDSREMERQDFDLKDIKSIYAAKPMFVQIEGGLPELGHVELNGNIVTVQGATPIRAPRDELTGITAGGKREIDYWGGEFTLGLNTQSGNTDQTNLSVSASLERRTPATTLSMNYSFNYNEVDGDANTNNQRFGLLDDIYLGRGVFVRPIQFNYYRDPIANIDKQIVVGAGAGYKIYDRSDLEWRVSAGPAYLKTWYENTPAGEDSEVGAPAAFLLSHFKLELTRRLDLILDYQGIFTTSDAGRYNQHAVSTLKFKVKNHVDLNVSFIWDRIESPQPEQDGHVPAQDDFRLNVGVGLRF